MDRNFRAAASFTRYLDQNHSWFLSIAAKRAFKDIKHKHENTGAGLYIKRQLRGPARRAPPGWLPGAAA